MNIVYIHTHDSGRFIQPYGQPFDNPALMELAQDGVLFRQAFCAGPTCSPSRAALLTGQYPHQCGMTGLAHRGFALNDYSKHLANFLSRNGYETALYGTQHEAPGTRLNELGYQEIFSSSQEFTTPEGEPLDHGRSQMAFDEANCDEAVEYISREKNKPFFLAFGMKSTHRGFPEPDADINPDYVLPAPTLPDNESTRRDMAGYATMLRTADNCVGKIMSALKENNLLDDTLVFFTTDHGIAFPRMKCNLHDSGTGISLIMRFPKKKFAGSVSDQLVSHVDVYPTLCDAAELKKPEWLEGESLLPMLDEKVEAVRDEVFSEVNYHAAYEPMRMARTRRYKYIRHFTDYNMTITANMDDGYSKQFLISDADLTERKAPAMEMLFDLYYDPLENANLINDPDKAEIAAEMRERLDSWMDRTNDPLLTGAVPKPEGAKVNVQDCLHPSDQNFE